MMFYWLFFLTLLTQAEFKKEKTQYKQSYGKWFISFIGYKITFLTFIIKKKKKNWIIDLLNVNGAG